MMQQHMVQYWINTYRDGHLADILKWKSEADIVRIAVGLDTESQAVIELEEHLAMRTGRVPESLVRYLDDLEAVTQAVLGEIERRSDK